MRETKEVTKQKITYTGIFDLKELYTLIKNWLKEEGFTNQVEAKSIEHVEENKRYIESQTEFKKAYSDDVQHTIGTIIKIEQLKDVTVDIENKKMEMNKGEIEINIEAKIIVDYKNRGNTQNPFLKTLLNKFITDQYQGEHEKILKEQIIQLQYILTTFLNMQERYFGIINQN